VLPKNARLTASEDFARTTKSGIRVTVENFVGYLYITPASESGAKCGLIINKTVGGSVVRHALARKVRHALAAEVTKLPAGSLLVVRALSQKKSTAMVITNNISADIESLVNKLLERQAKVTK
jgi:ribonuclease P protein component